MTHVVVREYGRLYRGTHARSLAADLTRAELPSAAFDALKALLVSAEGTPEGEGVLRYGLEGGREVLRASSWVGVLQTPDGTQLEILPKVLDDPADVDRTRQILVRMLAALPDAPFRLADVADLAAAKLPLMEVFAAVFLRALARLVRRGVAHEYVERDLELPALRGRLDLPRHLRARPSRPAVLAVSADEFVPDRPENRALRAALDRTRRVLTRAEWLRLHAELTFALADIPPSPDPDLDLRRWRSDRGHRHYAPLRPLAELILGGRNPLTAQGGARVPAVLFPMPEVFEAYVAAELLLARLPGGTERRFRQVETQVRGHHLVTQGHRRHFALRPDLRLTTPEGRHIIADTKWKRLDPALGPRAGLDQADLYQLHAYGHTYLGGQGELWLIYPRTNAFARPLPPFAYAPGLDLHILPFDLEQGRLVPAPD